MTTIRCRFDREKTDCSTSRLPHARVYENGLWIERVLYLGNQLIPRSRELEVKQKGTDLHVAGTCRRGDGPGLRDDYR